MKTCGRNSKIFVATVTKGRAIIKGADLELVTSGTSQINSVYILTINKEF
jgi:hypothetical protein